AVTKPMNARLLISSLIKDMPFNIFRLGALGYSLVPNQNSQFTRFRKIPTFQRVQRLMRVTTRTEAIREASEIDLVYLVEDRHHGLLNDFVLQRRNASWTLPPIS